MTFVRHLVEWHGESYAVEPSAEAQAGASLRVRAVISSPKAYGLSRDQLGATGGARSG